jgi:hypothetical protein
MSQENEMALTPVPEARVEVLPADPQRRIWPLVGAALVWTVRELLPELLAAWQASHSRTTQPVSLTPDVTTSLISASHHGHRFRRGRA